MAAPAARVAARSWAGLRALGFYHRRRRCRRNPPCSIIGRGGADTLRKPRCPHRTAVASADRARRSRGASTSPSTCSRRTPRARTKVAYIDDAGQLSYGELDERVRRFAAGAARARAAARGARAAADARRQRLAGRLPRRALRRRRAGRRQHAAHRRRLRLHARAQPRAGGARVGAAAADAASGDGARARTSSRCDRRLAPGQPTATARRPSSSCSRDAEPLAAPAPTARRRPRLLALLVGLDRRARKARCTPTPTSTGPPSSTASACSA